MKSAFILIAITVSTLVGDYYIKLASLQFQGLKSGVFVLGMVFYSLSAVGWFFLMRGHSLAVIGVLYSASNLLLLAFLGHFAFGETLGTRDVLGIALAIASVVVIGLRA